MTARGRWGGLAIVSVLLGACARDSTATAPAPAPSADKPAPALPTSSSSAPIPVLPPLPPIAHHPPLCEVEVFGRVKGLAAGAPPATIFLSDQDCLAPGAHILGTGASAKDGSFRLEVFSPWGSDVSICAAAIAADGKPATIYGKATGAYHAEKLGEVVFQDVEIALKIGPAKTFSRPGTSAAPSAGVPHGTP